MLSVAFLHDWYSLVLQMAWFSKMKRRQNISFGVCNRNSATALTKYGFSSQNSNLKLIQFVWEKHLSLLPAFFFISTKWLLYFQPPFHIPGRKNKDNQKEEGSSIYNKKDFPRNFPFTTFTYSAVAETKSDSRHIAKEFFTWVYCCLKQNLSFY